MKKSWSVLFTAKIQFVFIYMVLFYLALFLLTLRFNSIEIQKYGLFTAINNSFLFYCVATIPTLVIPIGWILKKKIPKQIHLTENTVEFVFNKRKKESVPLELLYYSVEDTESFYTLNLYKYQRIDQNGGFVDAITRINAPIISMGWKKSQLEDIVTTFKLLAIKEYKDERRSTFFDRLI